MGERPVRKRRVFYLSGFDPRGVAAYHRLFCEESQNHAALYGTSVRTGERKRESPLASVWRAERATADGAVETTFEFMHWDDIIRRHWHAGYVQLYRLAVKTYWYWIVKSDFIATLLRIARWNFVTAVAPAVVLFVLPPLALLAGWAGYSLVQGVFPQAGWLAALSGVASFATVIGLAGWLEQVFNLGWLLKIGRAHV